MTPDDLDEVVRDAKAWVEGMDCTDERLAAERAARAMLHAWRDVPGAHSYQRDTHDELQQAIDALDSEV